MSRREVDGWPFYGHRWCLLTLWILVVEEVIRAARQVRREQRQRRAADRAHRRKAPSRPRSLNPPPPPATAVPQWRRAHGTLLEALRFGSMLLDLAPTVDDSVVMRPNRAGTRNVIVARNPGLKGWLRQHCREANYQTALRYKRLAQQMRQACGLPNDVPLEWAFPDQAPHDADHGALTSADVPKARARLLAYLSRCASVYRLSAELQSLRKPLG